MRSRSRLLSLFALCVLVLMGAGMVRDAPRTDTEKSAPVGTDSPTGSPTAVTTGSPTAVAAATPPSWWWKELGLNKAPFYWAKAREQDPNVDERTALEALFRCESSCGHYDSKTFKPAIYWRRQCLNSTTTTQPCEMVQGNNSEQGKCAKNQTNCRLTPSFHLNQERMLYSLADVALEIARGKHTRKVKIVLLGDSIARQMFEMARCHLMRSVSLDTGEMVRVDPNANFAGWAPPVSQLARDAYNRLTIGKRHTFVIPSALLGEVEVSLMLQIAQRALVDDPELLLSICGEADLLVSTWGLHYADPHFGDFAAEMAPIVKVWRQCQDRGTTVLFAGHPMQHFFERLPEFGWYVKGTAHRACAGVPNRTLAAGMDRLDGWTQELRNLTKLLPTPWGREELAFCPNLGEKVGVHWMPWVELTRDFEHDHLKCGKLDCSHISLTPQLYSPLWDAMYLAVARDGRVRNAEKCTQSPFPPPQFSSLAKFRTGNATLSEQLQVNFEHMLGITNVYNNTELIPILGERGKEFKPLAEQFLKEQQAKLGNGTIRNTPV